MYTRRKIKPSVILRFAWKNLIIFTVYAIVVVIAHKTLGGMGFGIGIPFLPVSTIGIAVAFYLGFKNNQSYDRFWEGRKAWGGIVNYSRLWGSQTFSYLANGQHKPEFADARLAEARKQLIYRHIAWMNALRLQLRKTTIYDRLNITHVPVFTLGDEAPTGEKISDFIAPDEYKQLVGKANAAAQILRLQGEHLARLNAEELIAERQQIDFMKTIEQLYNMQGVCERIKNTPFPRQYAYMSTIFVSIFLIVLPLGLAEQFANLKTEGMIWMSVPFSVVISWLFSTMEIVGDNSEDPFENYVNDVPMTAISRNIEIDLREMLGETELPPRITPVNDVLL